MSKNSALRLLSIMELLPKSSDGSRGINTNQIYQELQQAGYEVSKRTVERDLNELMDIFPLDYMRKAEGKCWFLLDAYESKTNYIRPTEALMLVLSEKLILQTLPKTLAGKLETRIKNAQNILSSDMNYQRLVDKIHLISDGIPLASSLLLIDERSRECVYSGILKEQSIELAYQPSNSLSSYSFKANPVGIILRGHSQYLIASKKESPNELKLYLFNNIKSVENLFEPATIPNKEVLDSFIEKNPSGWVLKDEIINVELYVKSYAHEHLTRNNLADNQHTKKVDDLWYSVSFQITPTYDLIAWILKFGSDVICQKPEWLRKKIMAIMTDAIRQYEH